MTTPHISIIVPVYNTERYLSRCINSVISQSFTEWELLLIDDGSTDGSPVICDEYASRHSSVKSIHKSNGGASSARNTGIENARGEWICFLDSDDYINTDYLNSLITPTKNNPSIDLVISGLSVIHGHRVERFPLLYHGTLTNSVQLFEKINVYRFCGSYCKLFKADILRDCDGFSTKIIYSEDYDLLIRYLSRVHCIELIDLDDQYFYDKRENSISSTINAFEKELSGGKQLFNSVSAFLDVHNKCLNDIPQLSYILAYYAHRIIVSNYHIDYKYTVRLNNLRGIPEYLSSIYRDYYVPETKFLGILKFLYIRKFYHALNILLKIHDICK